MMDGYAQPHFVAFQVVLVRGSPTAEGGEMGVLWGHLVRLCPGEMVRRSGRPGVGVHAKVREGILKGTANLLTLSGMKDDMDILLGAWNG